MLLGALLLQCGVARAADLEATPIEIIRSLPESFSTVTHPAVMQAYDQRDLADLAAAADAGRLRYVNQSSVIDYEGKLDPEVAILMLLVPPGAPYHEQVFLRKAKLAYSLGVVDRLNWRVLENQDGSVNLELEYNSGKSQLWMLASDFEYLLTILQSPEYSHLLPTQEDRHYDHGISFNNKDIREPNLYATWLDNTLNDGANSYFLSMFIGADLRHEYSDPESEKTASVAIQDYRRSTTHVMGGYSWRGRRHLDYDSQRLRLSAGAYNIDSKLMIGTSDDPVPQAAHEGYVGLAWLSGRPIKSQSLEGGRYYKLSYEQDFGEYDFVNFNADLRYYFPLGNPLGIDVEEPCGDGCWNDIRRHWPAAQLALQGQLAIAEGDVPEVAKVRLGDGDALRGYTFGEHVGTSMAGLRAEYRVALDPQRRHEVFVFSDHALVGDHIDDFEELNSFGGGLLMTVELPEFGDVVVGAYGGWAYDGSDRQFDLLFAHQF